MYRVRGRRKRQYWPAKHNLNNPLSQRRLVLAHTLTLKGGWVYLASNASVLGARSFTNTINSGIS